MKPYHEQIDLEEAIGRVADDLHPLFEQSVQSRYLDEHGREKPNPTPVAPPIGYIKQPSIAEQMRMMIRQASYEAAQAGAETEAEANDFDVDEYDPTSPYEHDFEPDPALEHLLALQSAPPKPTTPPTATPSAPAGNPPAEGEKK